MMVMNIAADNRRERKKTDDTGTYPGKEKYGSDIGVALIKTGPCPTPTAAEEAGTSRGQSGMMCLQSLSI